MGHLNSTKFPLIQYVNSIFRWGLAYNKIDGCCKRFDWKGPMLLPGRALIHVLFRLGQRR